MKSFYNKNLVSDKKKKKYFKISYNNIYTFF